MRTRRKQQKRDSVSKTWFEWRRRLGERDNYAKDPGKMNELRFHLDRRPRSSFWQQTFIIQKSWASVSISIQIERFHSRGEFCFHFHFDLNRRIVFLFGVPSWKWHTGQYIEGRLERRRRPRDLRLNSHLGCSRNLGRISWYGIETWKWNHVFLGLSCNFPKYAFMKVSYFSSSCIL